MKKIISPVAITCILAVGISQTSCTNKESKKGTGINAADIDTTIDPTQDFFMYANGGWIKANPIPPDQTRWGSFNILIENNKKNLRNITEEAAKKTDSKKGSPAQLVGDFYFSAMDTANIE